MYKLQDVETRSEEIRTRINGICEELREHRYQPEVVSDLAEELGRLLYEAKILTANLVYIREVTRQLVKDPCSGPH